MGDTAPLRVDLTLELAPDADPPRGRVVSGGVDHPFAGWLGFALALEQAIRTEREAQKTTVLPSCEDHHAETTIATDTGHSQGRNR